MLKGRFKREVRNKNTALKVANKESAGNCQRIIIYL